jgi:type II secretory pathway component PulJ
MPHHCCDRRGLSLVETLLSATLLLLVLGLGARFLIPLLRMQADNGARSELQQRAAILLDELRDDLAHTTAAGVSLVQSPEEVLLGIHGLDNLAQDGTMVWRDSLVVYRWTSDEGLYKRAVWRDTERRLLRASAPCRISEETLRELAVQTPAQRVSSGVRQLEFAPLSGSVDGAMALPLAVRVSLDSPGGESRAVRRTLGGRLPSL